MSGSESKKGNSQKRRGSRPASRESDEETRRRIESLMKNDELFEEWIASRVEKVVKHWPKR
jgi:hypothetical protein